MKARLSRLLPLLAAGALLGGGLAAWKRSLAAPEPARAAREAAATPEGMAYVPTGPCLLGSNDPDADDDVRPQRQVVVPAFYIDLHEVTNREYRRFRPTHAYPAGEDLFPVTNVTYDEAAAYAAWAGKRLPTEAEWEKAARGTDGRRYPWGSAWEAARVAPRAKRSERQPHPPAPGEACSIGYSRVQPVGTRPRGASPYGCLDMAGNAWEWVQGFYGGNREQRILRGGAVGYGERACRAYLRAVEGAGVT